jgi:hypothetical protein
MGEDGAARAAASRQPNVARTPLRGAWPNGPGAQCSRESQLPLSMPARSSSAGSFVGMVGTRRQTAPSDATCYTAGTTAL